MPSYEVIWFLCLENATCLPIFYVSFIMILLLSLYWSKNFPSEKVKAQLIEKIYADGHLVYYTSNKVPI